MGTWLKRLGIAAAVVVLILLVGLWQLDNLVVAGVERGSTAALGVDTTLASASVGLRSGKTSLQGLRVANPDGFDSDTFVTLSSVHLDLSPRSLLSDEIEIQRFALDDLEVHLQRKNGKSNYGVILDHLGRFESGEKKPGEAPAEDGKRFVIHEIEITNVVVHTDLVPEAGKALRMELKIPRIRLEDVGTGEGAKGVSLSELAGVLVKAVLQAVMEKGGGILPDNLLGDLGDGLASLKGVDAEVLGEVTSQAKEMLGGAGESLQDRVDKLKDGVGGLLGGDRSKKKKRKR